MRSVIVVIVVNVGLAALLMGCGESVPQKSLRGGILSGTEVEQRQYAHRQNPILAGNGPQTVGPTDSATAPRTPISPTTLKHAAPVGQ